MNSTIDAKKPDDISIGNISPLSKTGFDILQELPHIESELPFPDEGEFGKIIGTKPELNRILTNMTERQVNETKNVERTRKIANQLYIKEKVPHYLVSGSWVIA